MSIVPVISLLLVLVLSLVVTRVATVALIFTGLSRESARFQARSAFSGVGFTTKESESIAIHPVRRRIVMGLMLLGNVGIATGMASIIVSLVDATTATLRLETLGIVVGAALALLMISRSAAVERVMSRAIAWALRRWSSLEIADYATLLHIGGAYGVVEVPVEEGRWLAGQTLKELALTEEGVLVLGVSRAEGGFHGVPSADMRIAVGDTLLAYGRTPRLAKIEARGPGPDGDRCRSEGVAEQHTALRDELAAAS